MPQADVPRLLVSVRNLAEAQAAVAGGADIIDLKEPSRGPLGAVEPGVIDEIAQWRSCSAHPMPPLSVALGELRDREQAPLAESLHKNNIAWAKIGLAGASAVGALWSSDWQRWKSRLPPSVTPVAVAYADHFHCAAPEPLEVLGNAIANSFRLLLVDTYKKDGASLFNFMSEGGIAKLIAEAARHGIQIALAGSLDAAGVRRAANLEPDIIAVRTAVCEGGRQGRVTAARVRELARLLKSPEMSPMPCQEFSASSN